MTNGFDDILYGYLLVHGFFEGDSFWINALNTGKASL